MKRFVFYGVSALLAGCTFDFDMNNRCFAGEECQMTVTSGPGAHQQIDGFHQDPDASTQQTDAHGKDEKTPFSNVPPDALFVAHGEDFLGQDFSVHKEPRFDPISRDAIVLDAELPSVDGAESDLPALEDALQDAEVSSPDVSPLLCTLSSDTKQSYATPYLGDSATLALLHFDEQHPFKNECGEDAFGNGTTTIESKIGFGTAQFFDGKNNVALPLEKDAVQLTLEMYLLLGKEENSFEGTQATLLQGTSQGLTKYALFLQANKFLKAVIGSETLFMKAEPLGTQDYTHIAFTYDGTTLRGYINGTIAAAKEVGTQDIAADLLTLGINYIGVIDEVRVSDVERTYD